jgi:hypothetical protein
VKEKSLENCPGNLRSHSENLRVSSGGEKKLMNLALKYCARIKRVTLSQISIKFWNSVPTAINPVVP